VSDRRGLPSRKMRHDAHYVDAIVSRHDEPIGKLVPIELIDPNPFQPRSQMGDLAELVVSVKERGILEPLIVRVAMGGRFQLISGERRLRAAQAAGLQRVPCVEIDADDGEALEVALVENIQRRDLNAFEEADGLLALKERFGLTHEQLARKLGRSRPAITETLSLAAIPEPVRDLALKKNVLARTSLVQVARAGSREKMEAAVLRMASEGARPQEVAKERQDEQAPKGRPKHFAFRWAAPEKTFAVQVKFKKSRVSKDEVIGALRKLLHQLESES
jgi:ParB family chromosome partitioning protein